MKTNSTLAIFLLAKAGALACASVLIMACIVGCASAYQPVPQATKPQNENSSESSMAIRNTRAKASSPTQKSKPVATQLLEVSAPIPTAPVTQSVAQSVAQPVAQDAPHSAQPATVVAEQSSQESVAVVATSPAPLELEVAPMHTEEAITASETLPAIAPVNSPEIQREEQPEVQPVVQPVVQPEIQPEIQPEMQPEVQPVAQPEMQPEVQPEIQTAKPPANNPATTTPVSRESGAAARQNLVLERANTSHAQIVLLGDSITEGWEGAPEQLQALVGLRSAANLGVGGDRTQHVLWRLEQAPLSAIKPKVIVLMIGTNNMYDDSANDIIAGIHAVVELLSAQCPNAEILVLDIPPRGEPKDSAREKITQINIGLTLGMWPTHARFVRVSGQFVKPDATIDPSIMPDLLHLSQKGYAMWAAAIKPELDCSLAANHPQPAPTTTHP